MPEYVSVPKASLIQVLEWLQSAMNVYGACPECHAKFYRGFDIIGSGHLNDCVLSECMKECLKPLNR
jgi:hypothetical protein